MALARARTSNADSVPRRAMRSASRKSVMALMIRLRRFRGKSHCEVGAAQGGAGMGAGPVARSGSGSDGGQVFAAAEADFARYEVVKDLIDECIDLSLNYRQSGHPGGSRSKVHMMVALLLSGAMRWDLLRPWRRFGDRFVLSAGHTVPLVYATLAVLNEAVRARFELSGDSSFAF